MKINEATSQQPDDAPLEFAELRARRGGRGFQLTVVDQEGNKFLLEYRLTHSPANFDPRRVPLAFRRWGNRQQGIACDDVAS